MTAQPVSESWHSEADPPPQAAPARPAVWTGLSLWSAVLALSSLVVALTLAARALRTDNARLQNGLIAAQTAAAAEPSLPPAVRQIQVTTAAVQAQIEQLEPVTAGLLARHVDWAAVMGLLGDYDAAQLQVTGLSQTENRLVIDGRANSDEAVMAYANRLENTGTFARVVVQSISAAATPFAAVTPSQGTSAPQALFLKQPLPLTFTAPQQEQVFVFLAKAGRFYEISTVKLGPGVDTVMTVEFADGTAYTNDDAQPGQLASKVTFQAPAATTQVTVRVTNLGQWGTKATYQLVADEIVPTRAGATPTSAAVSVTPVLLATAPAATPQATVEASPEPQAPVEFAILVEVNLPTP